MHKVLDRVLNKIKIFYNLNGTKELYVGVLLAENFSIVEQNFGDLMSNVLDRVVSDAFQIYNQDPYFLEKISYNSYIYSHILTKIINL